MKRLILCILLLNIALAAIFAQANNLPIKKINGIDYYIYTVQPSEGLYSISKRFNVSQAEINNLNPHIHDGLKVGQEIIIPVPAVASNNTNTSDARDYVEHRVEKRQTLFAISRIYKVSQDEIRKMNPQIEKGLKEGDIIRIPASSSAVVEKAKEAETNNKKSTGLEFVKHKIQPKETLYSISRLYQVDVAEISRLNPEIANNLPIGAELTIPVLKMTNGQGMDTVTRTKANGTSSTSQPVSFTSNGSRLKIAFLLPFMLDQPKTDAITQRFVDFYAGALIALDEAKRKGISVEVFTFDTDRTEDSMLEVLKNQELKNVDLIIGPAYTNQVAMMSDFARQNKIKTLIPFSSKVFDIDSNPYLFQFNPGMNTELDFVGKLFKNQLKSSNIVFAKIPNVNAMDDGSIFSEALQKILKKDNVSFKVVELNGANPLALSEAMQADGRNVLFFNTDRFNTANQYFADIVELQANQTILMYTQYSWLNQNHSAQRPSGFYVSPFKPYFDAGSTNNYNIKFAEFFKWNPQIDAPRYDVLGYDLTKYFVNMLKTQGVDFDKNSDKLPALEGIQSKMEFIRTSKRSGFINQQLYFVK